MDLWKTQKETLTVKDIEDYIEEHEDTMVPRLDKLWEYYEGKNTHILSRPKGDPNNPDNRTPVPYGRKIVTTFTGYAYRPRYTTYKVDDEALQPYMDQLQATFDASREHLRTHRAGRNTGIFGVAYEIVYVSDMARGADPRFVAADPHEIILLYDYQAEPQKKIGIRYYEVTAKLHKIEVYYPERLELYDRIRNEDVSIGSAEKWKVVPTGALPNYFDAVPMVPYYFGDDRLGVIEPVLPLIDDYDIIMSDSINEFERFAHAYMLLVKMGIVSPEKKKEPGALSRALQQLKRLRVFENLPDKDAVSFLTKDIPKEFIDWMTERLREQIHVQSHVPDFSSEKFGGQLSGAAIERLLFDFENVVSSAEADFEEGLYERLRLINTIYRKAGRLVIPESDVIITHKRNMPLNLQEFADTAVKMKNAGFSRWLVADIMPDDVVPNVEEELARQDEDMMLRMPDVDQFEPEETEEEEDAEELS